MGGYDYVAKYKYIATPKQAQRAGLISEYSKTTRIVVGGMERITYKEEINGVTYIRTKWRQKKKKVRKKRS